MFCCFRQKSKTATTAPNNPIPVQKKIITTSNPENFTPIAPQQQNNWQQNSNADVNKKMQNQPMDSKTLGNIMNYHIIQSGVVTNDEGWGEEKASKNDKNQAKTQFVKQIGAQITHSYLDNNSNQKGNNSAQNPLQFLGIGSTNTNTKNMGQSEILKLVFQLNPIFNKKQQNNSFPSPFIKYKIIPIIDEKKTLDSTSVNDQKHHLQKNSMIIWDFHGGPNQLFYIKSQGNGKVIIVNVARAFAIKSNNNQKDVFAEPRTSSQGSLWVLTQVGNYQYEIASAQNGKVIQLEKSKGSNGTLVVLGAKNGSKTQKWRIVPS